MIRGKIIPLTAAEVVARAKKHVNTGRYTLIPGYNGGTDPEASSPFGPTGKADCIGFALYCQGYDRFQEKLFMPEKGKQEAIYGGWINTNSILIPNKLFREVTDPAPGDMVVYPSYVSKRDGKKHYGHAMVVVSVLGKEDAKEVEYAIQLHRPSRESILRELRVIHCNATTRPAVALTRCRVPAEVNERWRFIRPRGR